MTSNIVLLADAFEYIKVNSDFGELFLVQNKTAVGEWSALYAEKGIYFRRDSRQSICVEYGRYYSQHDCNKYKDFLPTNMTVLQSSRKTFPDGLFQSWFFKRLQNLRMSQIGLTEIHRTGLMGANALNKFNLSHNALTEMPSKAFSSAWNLTEIDLSHNQITSMASDVFKVEFDSIRQIQNIPSLPDASSLLQIIRLNHNNLTFIDTEWFSNLLYLTTLKLNDNFLTEINACSLFSTNSALRTLELQNNDFSSIRTTGLFGGQCLNQIDTFDISNNPKNTDVGTISVNAKTINISNTNSLQCTIPQNAVVLRADHNRISSVSVELPNSNLQELYLNHNEIDSADFLHGLERLTVIDLSHNQLTEINGNVLDNMVDLTSLDISHNKFSVIDFAFIKPAGSLEYLDISNNLLSGHFNLNVETNALVELNIANNNFTSLQHNLRKQMPRLSYINLNNNFFNCEDLTSMLLFMHFDGITSIVQTEDDLNETNNIRGIKCQQSKYDLDAKNSTATTYKTMQENLINTIDEKLANLETKLIELFKNGTELKTTDSKIE